MSREDVRFGSADAECAGCLYRPGGGSDDPGPCVSLLLQVMSDDVVTPPEPARKAAERAPRGELIEYEGGHFDVYVGEPFERAVADQLAFLDRVL